METIRELLGSVRLYLKDRLSNPLWGAYVIAWAVFNSRLLLVLIGDGGWREKITYIDTRLYPENWQWAWFGLAYPLVVALLFVLIAPFIGRWVTIFLKAREKVTLEQLLAIADETPMPKGVAAQLRQNALSERQLRISERQRASEEMAELTRQIDHLLKENQQLRADSVKATTSANADPAESEMPTFVENPEGGKTMTTKYSCWKRTTLSAFRNQWYCSWPLAA
jgi:hypothetical protein